MNRKADVSQEQADEGRSTRGSNELPRDASRWGRLWQRRSFRVAVIAAALVMAGGVVFWWLSGGDYVSTSDAFLDTRMVQVAPRISGRVAAVPVAENQQVTDGALLVRLDATRYQAQLRQAKARLASARAQVDQAEADVDSAKAQADNARRELERSRHLGSAISQERLDQATAAERTDVAKLAAARQRVESARAQVRVAQAAVHTAELQVGYTEIRAPEAGHVAQQSVAVGDYVAPGEAMMMLVPDRLWVTANFKETEIDRMRPGQPATIVIDACGGRRVSGHVVSIQHGAGQAFQILPPQNATGNFVKVVQRVPVHIALDDLPKHCVLGPGMSVEPNVKVD